MGGERRWFGYGSTFCGGMKERQRKGGGEQQMGRRGRTKEENIEKIFEI